MDRRTFLQTSSIGAALSLAGSRAYAQAEQTSPLAEELLEELNGSAFFTSATDEIAVRRPTDRIFSDGAKPFAIYQLREKSGGGGRKMEVVDPGNVEPEIRGSDENPDVGIKLSLEGAHFAQSVWADVRERSRATLRITSKGDTLNNADTLHWALTAGLNLYQAYKGGGRITNPIEIGTLLTRTGQSLQFSEGTGALQISVLKHRQPSWWNQVFSFLRGAGGNALIGAIGFPAITVSALRFVDELTNQMADRGRQPVFQASFANVAFSERGFEASRYPAVLNKGLWLVVSPSDREKFEEYEAYYYGGYARMIPGSVEDPSDMLGRDDPFSDISYAVLNANISPGRFL